MNSGQELWKRAKNLIPGGNMLLSKRPEMFLPEHWPAYFSKAKGCKVWDMDGKQYTDMCIICALGSARELPRELISPALISSTLRAG